MRVQVIKKLAGANWPKLKVEFDRWRSAGQSIFPEEVWEAADCYHGYQWWASFGDDFEFLSKAAADVLSKPISASSCECNWSDVGHIINKKTSRLGDSKINKIINVRAMHRLEKNVKQVVLLGNIPKLEDFLDELVNEAMQTGGEGDDVADVVVDWDESSDDEDFDVVAEDEEPLYELGGQLSTAMEDQVMRQL